MWFWVWLFSHAADEHRGNCKKHGVEIESFCGDVSTCSANTCDVIFCSVDLSDRVRQHAKVPVVAINRLMDKQEVEEKFLKFIDGFERKGE